MAIACAVLKILPASCLVFFSGVEIFSSRMVYVFMICTWTSTDNSNIMNNPEEESLDKSCAESFRNGSFLSALDQSLDSSAYLLPTFEFSSPISSIASDDNSSPERDQTLQTREPLNEQDISDNFMSIEEIQSLISPPYNTPKGREGLETIFENRLLETGPGTPTTPRIQLTRRARINLNNFDEFKENLLESHELPNDQVNPSSTDISNDFSKLLQDLKKSTVNSEWYTDVCIKMIGTSGVSKETKK